MSDRAKNLASKIEPGKKSHTGWRMLPPRTTWIVLSSFMVLGLLSTFYFYRHYRAQEELYLAKLVEAQEVAWRAATSIFRVAAEVYQEAYFNDPELLEMMRKGEELDEPGTIRQELLQRHLPIFLQMQNQGIRQLVYILPDGTVFLRFHASEHFGDNAMLTRSPVHLAITEKVPVTSFQVSRIGSGYLLVFPLLTEFGDLRGAVEIAMPFSVLEREVAMLDPKAKFEVVLNRELLDPLLLSDQDRRFPVWSGSSQFRKEVPADLPEDRRLLLAGLSEELSRNPRTGEILSTGSAGSVALRFQGAEFSATLTPIRDLAHQIAGYLVAYAPAPGLSMLSLNFILSTVVAWVVLGILAVALKLVLESWDSIARERTQLRAISNTMLEGLFFLDAKGAVLDINDSALRLTKSSRNQTSGQKIGELFGRIEEDGNSMPIESEIIQVAASGHRYENEVLLLGRGTKKVPVALAVSPLLRNGGLVGLVATFRDITEQRAARESLEKARQEEAAANRAKSIFLATMSHEIRTPLNAVVGTSSLLIEANLRPEQRELAETIVSGCEALLSVVNDILDYSRIESGKVELEKERFDVADLAAEALEMFGVKAAEKKIGLLYRILPEVPSVVRGDASRLRQVLLNLISNAVKFTDEGEVVVEVRSTRLPSNKLNLDFSVRDTGVGIPDRALKRLFSPFEQADASVSRQYGGSGLGLAISKRLVELMGGQIQVWSVPGAGTDFRFHVLVDEVPRRPPLYHCEEAKPLEGKHVLAAFEHPARRKTFCAMMLAWGMEVKTCDLPADFSDLLAASRPDAIVLDGAFLQKCEALGFSLPNGLRTFIVTTSATNNDNETDGLIRLQQPVRPTLLLRALLAGLCNVEFAPKVLTAPKRIEEKLRVLLAEDNPVNQRVVALMLKKLGCEVQMVANGKEALDALEKEKFAVVLMDIQMPEMDGLRATQEILQRCPDPKKRPKIIALTANALKGDKEVCLDAGMDDYLAKPVRLAELSACIEAIRFSAGKL